MVIPISVSRIPLLEDPPFVIALLAIACGLGLRVLVLIGAPVGELGRLQKGVIASALGLGLLPFIPMALATVGQLTTTNLWISLAAVGLLTARDSWRCLRAVGLSIRSVKLPREPWILAGSAVVLASLAIALLQALAPPTDTDGIGYHLFAPRQWLSAHRLVYLPTVVHTNGPMGVEMLFAIALGLWSDTSAKLIHYALGCLSMASVYVLASTIRGPRAGFGAIMLWVILSPKPTVFALFGTAYIDLGVSFQVCCAHLAFLLWLRSRANSWMICSALFSGFAVSYKLTAAFVGPILALLVFLGSRRQGDTLQLSTKQLAWYVALSCLPALPWLCKSYVQTGNPVYPLFSGVFKSRSWGPDIANAFSTWFKYCNWGVSKSGVMALANRRWIVAIAAVAVALTGVISYRRLASQEIRALVFSATGLALVFVFTTGLYLRFLLMITPLVAVCLAVSLKPAWSGSRLVQYATTTLLLILCLPFIRRTTQSLKQEVLVAAGRVDRPAYLRDRVPLYKVYEYSNQRLRSDARILLAIGGGALYYSERTTLITDCVRQYSFRFNNWDEFLGDVRSENIKYLIAPNQELDFNGYGQYSKYLNYPAALKEPVYVRRLAVNFGRPLMSNGSETLFELSL